MKISSNFRKLLILLVLSSLSMLIMNCSKSDSDASTPTAQIVGTWKVISILQGLFIKKDGDSKN